MRLLLDENMWRDTAIILTLLGHPSQRSIDVTGRGASDVAIAERIAEYDAFVTADLHRQPHERRAINEAIVAGANVVRIRYRRGEPDDAMAEVRSLIWKWPTIQAAVQDDEIGLITVSAQGNRIRTNSRSFVASRLADDT